jgi:hypothetical protein
MLGVSINESQITFQTLLKVFWMYAGGMLKAWLFLQVYILPASVHGVLFLIYLFDVSYKFYDIYM